MPAATLTAQDALARRIQPMVHEDQVHHLQRGDPMYLLGNAVVAIMAVIVLRHTAPLPWLLGWLAAILLATAGHGWMTWRQQGRADQIERQLRNVTRLSALSGLLWAAGVLLVYPGADDIHRALLIVMLAGMATIGTYRAHSAGRCAASENFALVAMPASITISRARWMSSAPG
jgi:hypothetical protein